MKFSMFMTFLVTMMKLNLKRRPNVRDMIKYKNHKIVMKTKDGKRGKRFIFNNGEFSVDDDLDDFDLAYIWKDGATALRVFTNPDPTGLLKAQANWDLEMEGDESLSVWFTIFLGFATGTLKKR